MKGKNACLLSFCIYIFFFFCQIVSKKNSKNKKKGILALFEQKVVTLHSKSNKT